MGIWCEQKPIRSRRRKQQLRDGDHVYPYVLRGISGIRITVGGTFATGETVTVKITFYWNDGSSTYIEKPFTATGTYDLTVSDLLSLLKNDVYLTSIGAQAKTDQASTSVTVDVTVAGLG